MVDGDISASVIKDRADGHSALGPSNGSRWLTFDGVIPWAPPADVFELSDRLVVQIEVAGMREDDLHVKMQERRLIVSGIRARKINAAPIDYHQTEVHYGAFQTEVVLPWAAAPEAISAIYRDGFLTIELPRAANRQIHVLNVGIDDGDA